MSNDSSNEHKVVGQRLRDARESIGFTQQQVADALQVSRPTLVALEQGTRKITGLELRRLARLYQRDVGWLLGDEPAAATATNAALHHATEALSEADREQVLRFAEFLATQNRGGVRSPRTRPRPPRTNDET
jgi:transcriptional regulator with XRE-family HTH domain